MKFKEAAIADKVLKYLNKNSKQSRLELGNRKFDSIWFEKIITDLNLKVSEDRLRHILKEARREYGEKFKPFLLGDEHNIITKNFETENFVRNTSFLKISLERFVRNVTALIVSFIFGFISSAIVQQYFPIHFKEASKQQPIQVQKIKRDSSNGKTKNQVQNKVDSQKNSK